MSEWQDSESLQRIYDFYVARVAPQNKSHHILGWSSRSAQLERFRVLADVLRSQSLRAVRGERADLPPTLLDIGCGLTDLAVYLEINGVNCQYVGTDITEEIILEARRRFPENPVVLADVFKASPFTQPFDVTFASGVFNLNIGNNDAFLHRVFPAIWRLTSGCMVINFLHKRTREKYSECHYYDPDLVRHAARELTDDFRIIDDYLENDFTLVAFV